MTLAPDAIAVFEDEELPVHSYLLRMVSPVFEAMFSSTMVEGESKRFVVDVASKDQFSTLCSWLHPLSGRKVLIKEENVDYMLKLSNYYQIDELKEQCRSFLLRLVYAGPPPRSAPKGVTVARLLLAQEAGLKDIVERFIPLIGHYLDEFDLSPLDDHPQILAAVIANVKKAFVVKKRRLNELESTAERTKDELSKKTALLAEVKPVLQKINAVVPVAIPGSKMYEGKRMDSWLIGETNKLLQKI